MIPLTEEEDDDSRRSDIEVYNSLGLRPKKCYGLVLSDSHNTGPYQAGVIKALAQEHHQSTDGEYQIVSGIALGALNAHILSQYPKGEEVQAAEKMIEFWTKLG